jgi:hypothetical protein
MKRIQALFGGIKVCVHGSIFIIDWLDAKLDRPGQ